MPEISPGLYRAGSGEPLVLLHGFTGSWHHWRPVLPELVARYDVIAPTLAGHEGGPPMDPEFASTIEHAADHLEAHLDEIGVGTAHFAGNSMGGALSLELAKRGRARSVVALSPGGLWEADGGEGERIARFFTRLVKLNRATVRHADLISRYPMVRKIGMRDIMRHGELVAPADAAQLMRAQAGCTVVEPVVEAVRRGTALLSGLDQIQAPVLVAWSERDRVLPKERHSARARREIPGVQYTVLPHVGHVPMWDDSALVVRTITAFVDRHATGEPAGTVPATEAA